MKTAQASTLLPLNGQAKNVTFWGTVATTKWGQYLTELERRLVTLGNALAGEPGAGIDLGCGSGRWSRQLTDAGWRMTCIDASPKDLAVCQTNVPEAQSILVARDSSVIPCLSRSCGILLCIEVGPVIESNWFVPEVTRVLSDRGILVGVFCNRHSWRGLVGRLKYRLNGRRGANDFYNVDYSSFRKKLTAAGFELVHQEGLCWGPAGRCSDSALVPFYIKLERALRLNRFVAISPWIAFIARKTVESTSR